MTEAASLAVIQDVFVLAGFSLALGMIVYALLRMRTGLAWNNEGNVLSRPYDLPDVIVALLLLSFFAWTATLPSVDRPDPSTVSAGQYAMGLLLNSILSLLIVGVLLVYMGLYRRLNPAEMFGMRQLSVGRAFGQAFIWLLGVALAITAAYYTVSVLSLGGQWLDDAPQEVVQTFLKSNNLGVRIFLAAFAIFIAPVTEEVIFRGYLYGVVKHYSDRWFAAAFTALVFAAMHQHVGSLFPLFLLAIGFAVAYEVTGCLLVPIFMHMMFNGFNILMLFRQ